MEFVEVTADYIDAFGELTQRGGKDHRGNPFDGIKRLHDLVPKGMSLAELISKNGHMEGRHREAGFPDIFPVKVNPADSEDYEYDARVREYAANKGYHPAMVATPPTRGVNENKMKTTKENKMKITKRQLRRIIKEERSKLLSEAMSPDDIMPNMGTEFYLGDESGALSVSGNLLDPDSLRQLAATLEKLYAGQIQVDGMVGFDID